MEKNSAPGRELLRTLFDKVFLLMNILYLAHRIPYPPNKGDKIRSFNEIKYLSKRHDIYLACFLDDRLDLSYIDNLKEYCKEIKYVLLNRFFSRANALVSMLKLQSLSVGYYKSSAMHSIVNDILDRVKIDYAIIFSSTMGQFVSDRKNLIKVMDFVDVDSEKWRDYGKKMRFPMSILYRWEADRLKKFEIRMSDISDYSIFVTESEKELFLSFHPKGKIEVVRNGVDNVYYNRSIPYAGNQKPPRAVFVGAMDYFPNVDGVLHFSEKILPKIWMEIEEFEFSIVGRNPPLKVRQLAESDRRIQVHGTVHDVRPFLESATLAVVPLRIARGIQNKVLEAMAMGVPVVVTPNAYAGIEAENGEHLIVADSDMEMAEEIIRLVKNRNKRIYLSEQSRKFIEKMCSWDSQMIKLGDILEKCSTC